jgi:hypothetical protein
MATETLPLELQHNLPSTRWSLASRIVFRFCFVYFGLYCLFNQIITALIPVTADIPDPSTLWPMCPIVLWTAAHIFRVTKPLVYTGSGSGDKTFDWVLSFCLLVIAVVAAAIWSVVDSKRKNYIAVAKWFRMFIRIALAGQMFVYGTSKAVPVQMPFPLLRQLIQPYGNFSPMGILWSFVGTSRAYEIFTGCAEILSGVLLIVPRTAMLGALICLADMTQVLMLNMAYDTPVKLFSFHLILISVFLLAPDARRLVDFFALGREPKPSAEPSLFRSRRANHVALILQVAFGVLLLGVNFYGARTNWYLYGGGAPKSALYGIWDVRELSIDGQIRSPLLNDYDRWRRVIFEWPTLVYFERMDDTFVRFASSINVTDKTVGLTKSTDKDWKANFTFQRPAPNELTLDGDMNGHKTHMQLELVDHSKFVLTNRGFHWISEYPFNR